jgi:hypothetical protein
VVFDEHDVVNGLLDGEGRERFVGVDLAGGAHDLGEAVVEAVEVTSKVVLRFAFLFAHLFFLFVLT